MEAILIQTRLDVGTESETSFFDHSMAQILGTEPVYKFIMMEGPIPSKTRLWFYFDLGLSKCFI